MSRRKIPRVHQGVRWIEVGCKVSFDPLYYIQSFGSSDFRGNPVTGTVVYVNKPHKWFLVEYGGLRTSFKFADLGLEVVVCG